MSESFIFKYSFIFNFDIEYRFHFLNPEIIAETRYFVIYKSKILWMTSRLQNNHKKPSLHSPQKNHKNSWRLSIFFDVESSPRTLYSFAFINWPRSPWASRSAWGLLGWPRHIKPLTSLEVVGWQGFVKPLTSLKLLDSLRPLKRLAPLGVIDWPKFI